MIKNRNLSPAARRREIVLWPHKAQTGDNLDFTQNATNTAVIWPIGRKLKITRVTYACSVAPAGGTLTLLLDNVDKSEGGTDVLTSAFDAETLVANQAANATLLTTVEGGERFTVVDAGDVLKLRAVASNDAVGTNVSGLVVSIEFEYVDELIDTAVSLST